MDVPETVLSYTPPTPPRGGGGGARRRLRRPAWGIGAIATDPEAWTAGTQRRRLVRAATLTSVMGVAWAGPQLVSAPPASTPSDLAAAVDEAAEEGEAGDLLTSPVAYQRGEGGDASKAAGAKARSEGVRAARTGSPAVAPTPDKAEDAAAWRDNVVARWGPVDIHQMSPEVRMVGFHEGGSRADDVRPAARPDRDLGKEKVATGRGRSDLPSMILPGRGRGTGSATAIDVAMPDGEKVYAPITGTVTAANDYSLYGKHPDTIITIQPDGHPEVMMEILHVEGVQVEVGDRVVAGKTPIADSANLLPFGSQIDRYVKLNGRPMPHVHIEMQRL